MTILAKFGFNSQTPMDEESHPTKKLKFLPTILSKEDFDFDDGENNKPLFKYKPKVLGRVWEQTKDL